MHLISSISTCVIIALFLQCLSASHIHPSHPHLGAWTHPLPKPHALQHRFSPYNPTFLIKTYRAWEEHEPAKAAQLALVRASEASVEYTALSGYFFSTIQEAIHQFKSAYPGIPVIMTTDRFGHDLNWLVDPVMSPEQRWVSQYNILIGEHCKKMGTRVPFKRAPSPEERCFVFKVRSISHSDYFE